MPLLLSLVQARAVAASQHQHPAQSDRVLMGLAHRTLPLYGVQYHPESVGTSHGQALIRNFWALAAAWPQKAGALAGHLAWSLIAPEFLGMCHTSYTSAPHPGC